MAQYDVVIIGSGAAGLAAGVYAGRYKMNTLIIGAEFGGETSTAGSIENYPGVEAIDGYELMNIMKKQAIAVGVEIQDAKVTAIAKQQEQFEVTTEQGKTYSASCVIIAIGSQRRKLGLAREAELTGNGVHYCWTCDGPLYGGKTLAMVGGGDSSVKGINFLAEYAEKLYLIVRGDKVTAEPINYSRMQELGNKVEVLLENEITELQGETRLEKLVLRQKYNGSNELVVDGVFIEIGFNPDKTFAEQLGLELDEKGFTKVDNHMNTNIEGVFVAGDTTRHFGDFKQDITAAAMGAVAATAAYEYTSKHGK